MRWPVNTTQTERASKERCMAVSERITLTERIKERAIELGFDLARITTAAPLPAAERALKERIRAGLMDGLDWFTEARAEVSCDPRALLPGARSVIALATFYLTDAPRDETAPGDPHGQLSCYAWGEDYHDVIRKRLDALAGFIRALAPPGDEKSIVFVDTGRMVDRAVAARSGLGWYGKNTNILTKRWGSWVFLAELVTSLDLEPDTSVGASCGRCEICLHACPTNAFVAPYVLDNRRCISYLTIELRGSIPLELRPLIGNRIFGCDDCLDACPWNRFAQASRETAFFARKTTTGMLLRDYLELGDAEFRTLFRNSLIKRIKRRGFLRNVCVALGNVGGLADLPALKR